MRAAVAFVAGLITGALGVLAALFVLLADREPLVRDAEPTVEYVKLPYLISRREYDELIADGYGPDGFYGRMIRDYLGGMVDGEPIGV